MSGLSVMDVVRMLKQSRGLQVAFLVLVDVQELRAVFFNIVAGIVRPPL